MPQSPQTQGAVRESIAPMPVACTRQDDVYHKFLKHRVVSFQNMPLCVYWKRSLLNDLRHLWNDAGLIFVLHFVETIIPKLKHPQLAPIPTPSETIAMGSKTRLLSQSKQWTTWINYVSGPIASHTSSSLLSPNSIQSTGMASCPLFPQEKNNNKKTRSLPCWTEIQRWAGSQWNYVSRTRWRNSH